MTERDAAVNIKGGLVAEKAAVFVQLANNFDSEIIVLYKDKNVNAKSIMGMMALSLAEGEKVSVKAEGPDSEQAVLALCSYLDGRE